MKKTIGIIGSVCKKLFFLCFCMVTGIYSFAAGNITGRHLLWEYDGILPFIAYTIFGIITICIAYVSIRSWIDNRHDHIQHR